MTIACAAVLAVALGLASCSSGVAQPDSAQPDSGQTGAGQTGAGQTVSVEAGASPGLDVVRAVDRGVDLAVNDLPGIVEDALKASGIPGAAVAVVHDGEVLFSQGFGVKRLGEPDKVDAATVFQIASVSKPISATIVAAEVAKGKVSWDTPVSTLMPSFTLGDSYVTEQGTVGDYFSHRTGLPKAAGDSLEDIGYGRAEVLSRLNQLPLDPFRITYAYANFGLTAGAEAVAESVGVPWEDLADQALFAPLGMDHTSARYADFVAEQDRATLHTKIGDDFAAVNLRDPDASRPPAG